MALDIKAIVSEAFMELCERKAVEKITVKDILEKTGLSRKGFYNHFSDKNDLIHYCYDKIICPPWNCPAWNLEQLEVYNKEWLENMIKYKRFMKSACSIYEPNGLRDYILTKDRKSDLEWYESITSEELTKDMKLCIDYHSGASRYIIIEWVLSDMPIPVESLLNLIRTNRKVILEMLKPNLITNKQ